MTGRITLSADIVVLTDGRSGYFYRSHFVGNLIFQPVDCEGNDKGVPELADEDHVIERKAV